MQRHASTSHAYLCAYALHVQGASGAVAYAVADHFDLGFLPGMLQRKALREKYNIPGSGCDDCCVHTWCRWAWVGRLHAACA